MGFIVETLRCDIQKVQHFSGSERQKEIPSQAQSSLLGLGLALVAWSQIGLVSVDDVLKATSATWKIFSVSSAVFLTYTGNSRVRRLSKCPKYKDIPLWTISGSKVRSAGPLAASSFSNPVLGKMMG